MFTTIEISARQKAAYQRPYKTRSQRREIARRKHDENADYKFLVRVGIVAGVLLLLVVGTVLHGVSGNNDQNQALTEVQR